jgi:lysophospholipase L1-like esterase
MRRVAAAIALLVATALVSAALLEIGVRVFLGPQVRFPRRVVGAPFGLRINEPHARYRHSSPDVDVEFRINGRGLRDDREFPYEKPPGVARIVSLGDSFTAGYEVEGDQTFSSVLERSLRARGVAVEVLNAGVSGYSTAEEALYLERELYRYSPDLVLVSYYGNDLVDNARAGLFALEGDRLVDKAQSYVPGGGLGDFLNTNPIANFLSEKSDAFVLLKEVATRLAKQRVIEENVGQIAAAEKLGVSDHPFAVAQRRLAAALFERIYAGTRERGIPLVVQSIPTPIYPNGIDGMKVVLVEMFPLAEFPTERPGLLFFSAKSVLDPAVGRELLYYLRSHGHWTPYSHRVDGEALAERILAAGLLAP